MMYTAWNGNPLRTVSVQHTTAFGIQVPQTAASVWAGSQAIGTYSRSVEHGHCSPAQPCCRAVEQVPGVVVMEIKSASVAGAEGGTEDPLHKRIIVVFNARPDVYEAGWPAGQR